MEKGLVHIYCGDGKGKTTASIGLAVRAAGRGKRVLIARFMKTNDSGELFILDRIPEITILPTEKSFHLIGVKNDDVPNEAKEYFTSYFALAVRTAKNEKYDLLIFDEINGAVRKGLIDVQLVTDFLESRPDHLEIVMTGRRPLPEMEAFADYVSEIKKVKHPFDEGIMAREGIEF